MLPGLMGLRLPSPPPPAGLIVAAGRTGTSAYIATSPDGSTWTSRTVSGATLNGVAYSSSLGLYVAVGNSGNIVSSPDGITWTSRTSGTSNTLWAITWNGSVFAVASNDATQCLTSSDGTSWTIRTTSLGAGSCRGIFSIGSRIILLSDNTSSVSDTNGTSWSTVSMNTASYRSGAGTSTQAVAVASAGRISRTTDNGANWSAQTTGSTFDFTAVAWSGSLFCAAGSLQIRTSSDGTSWTAQGTSLTSGKTLLGAIWTGSQFIVVGNDGTNPVVLTSSDGTNWSQPSIGLTSASFNAVCS